MARPRSSDSSADPERISGVVARLLRDKGFGFIRKDNGGSEVFFHYTAAPDWDTLAEGARVDFVERPSPKGPRAEQVQLV